jgi:N-acetyl-gamma-glutamyl-phosphate reductase
MIKVGIIGATGYAGAESIRLLSGHPGFEISCVVSKTFEGKKISEVYPSLSGICDLTCESLDYDTITNKADCFISALPHAASQEAVYKLVSTGKKVVDLSADYRYSSVALYEKTYGLTHAYPKMMTQTVYGLPEIYRDDIKGKNVIANPGCYPTCSILALAPLLAEGLIDETDITINAVSGVSGAGRKESLAYAFCEVDDNFAPYKITGHRHNSEIEEQLSAIAGKTVLAGFTPHLAPFKRGMSATIYTKAKKALSPGDLADIYNMYYKNEYFIRIKEEGNTPSVKAVAGTNFADIMPIYDKRLNRIIVVSAIDNLGKGAASQAIQNLNIMCGLCETDGLTGAGLYI